MTLNYIQLTNFRSYKDQGFAFGDGVTVVMGPNASGKTNLLEAIYTLAVLKSFRGKDPALIHHNQDYYRIEAGVGDRKLALAYKVEPAKTQKKISHNDVVMTAQSHIGSLPVTLFEPYDLLMVGGAPELRRRYLDTLLCQIHKQYFKNLTSYKRVLKQRNSLLADHRGGSVADEIFAWDVKLTELAALLVAERRDLITKINNQLPLLYSDIAGEQMPIALTYSAGVSGKDYASGFLEQLQQNLARDLAAGFTTIGPHREDFRIKFRGSEMESVASRGEVRTAVLAMKLAELAVVEAELGVKPLLLLDDVFSELDGHRRSYLMEIIKSQQAIITTTEEDAWLKQLRKGSKIIKTGVS